MIKKLLFILIYCHIVCKDTHNNMDNKKLETLRDDINSLDDKILDLLKQRAEIVIEIGQL